jgi:hypothetical protein
VRLLRRHLGDVRVLAIANRDKWNGRVVVTLCVVVTSRSSALWLAQLLCAELTLPAPYAASQVNPLNDELNPICHLLIL